MNQVDTILNCRWVIPIEPYNTLHENYAIIIHNGLIVDLLPQEKVSELYSSHNSIDLNKHAVLPGFINAHTHSPMIYFKGLADDLPLMDWLNNYIWPTERKWLGPEFIQSSTQFAIAEMLKNGTTCFNEHYFFPEIIAEAVQATKIRACIGATIINFETVWSKNEEDGFEKFQGFYNKYKDKPLLTFSLAPHSPYGTTDKILSKIAAFSEKYNLPIHMHVHETEVEVMESLEKYGKRPLRRLYDLGLLSKRLQCVHMTQVNSEDFELLELTKANIIHCPESNLKLASGYCPVQKLLENNINVALGTDSAASNNNLDMIGEMRTAALLGKVVAASATALNAVDVLRMATINGAKALGLEDKIGSIEKGKSADITAINLHHLNTQPIYNPISQIVYAASNTQITDVWVAGKQLLKEQELTTIDEDVAVANAWTWRDRILT